MRDSFEITRTSWIVLPFNSSSWEQLEASNTFRVTRSYYTTKSLEEFTESGDLNSRKKLWDVARNIRMLRKEGSSFEPLVLHVLRCFELSRFDATRIVELL